MKLGPATRTLLGQDRPGHISRVLPHRDRRRHMVGAQTDTRNQALREGRTGHRRRHRDADGHRLPDLLRGRRQGARNRREPRPPGVAAPIKLPTVADAAERYMKWFCTARKSASGDSDVIDTHILPELGTMRPGGTAHGTPARMAGQGGGKAPRRKPRIPRVAAARCRAAPADRRQQARAAGTANRMLQRPARDPESRLQARHGRGRYRLAPHQSVPAAPMSRRCGS